MSAVFKIAEMEQYLADDLYKHVDPLDPEQFARAMESPLKWRVEWCIKRRDYDTPGAGARVKARIVDPVGKEFASCPDADADWLHAVLP